MKHSIFTFAFAAVIAAAITVFTSCEKSADIERPSSVQTSDAIGQIFFEGSPNNLFVVPSGSQNLNLTLNTNLPCLSYASDGYVSGYGFSLECKSDVGSTGRVNYSFSSGGNIGNTLDCTFFMIQSLWNNSWVDYSRYGMIETPVVFRVRGLLGENILPLNNPGSWKSGIDYYLKGVVTGISEISESAKEFETIGICKSMFASLNFTPSLTLFTAESVVFTVETEAGTVEVQAYGKKRDGEVSKLLGNVGIGDRIEFPAVAKNETDVRNRNLQPVRTAAVLKLD